MFTRAFVLSLLLCAGCDTSGARHGVDGSGVPAEDHRDAQGAVTGVVVQSEGTLVMGEGPVYSLTVID